ncbi:MAG: hypothetical protein UHO61_08605 [Acutalibacteraceae bacterium]|nr:hypothetical protein [Acutalibacteraceae bacterium]
MAGAIIAFAFGILQAFLLKSTLFSFTAGNYQKAALFLIVKFITYGAAAILLVFLFSDYIINCVIGYGAGLPVAVAVWFIINTIRGKNADSGDGKNEDSNNN